MNKIAQSQKQVSHRQEQEEILKKQRIADFQEICTTEGGIRAMKWIFTSTGYNQSNCMHNPHTGGLDASSMIFNEGCRTIWISIRKYLSKNIRSKIEI